MQKFTDNAGREWRIDVNMGTRAKVLDAAGINLADLTSFNDVDTLSRLADDPSVYFNTITTLLAGQMEEAGVSEEDLARGFDEDTVEASVRCIILAAIDNAPKSGRETLRRSFLKSWNHVAAQRDEQAVKMNEMLDSGELDRAIDKALAETSSAS